MNRTQVISSLPLPSGRFVEVEKNQTVPDIISLMVFAHEKNEGYYDQISAQFWKGSVDATCENLWNFCKTNIPYKEQSDDLQTIKTPQRILRDSGDCKHYASFIGGVLDSLKRHGKQINWSYRFASYQIFGGTPGHVFVVVKVSGREIWIDPVLNNYNEKKQPTSYTDKKIYNTLGAIGGCGCEPAAIGDAKTVQTINTTGAVIDVAAGVVMAIAPVVAAVVPVGTIVAAVLVAVVGVTELLAKMFQGKYSYSTQVRWLIQNYQFRVLGQCGVTSDNKVNESYANAAWLWFSVCLGIPIWDNLRIHALRGTDPNTDKTLNQTRAQKIAAYYSFGSLEKQSSTVAVGNAVDIATTFDDYDTCGGWKNFYPANIVLTNGLSTDEASAQAAPLLAGTTEADIQGGTTPPVSLLNPLSNIFGSIPTPVLLIAAGFGLYLLTDN